MTAAAAIKSPVLRNAAGEPPLGIGGLAFRDDQGEIFQHPVASYRNPLTQTGVLELEGGDFLAYPFRVDGELFTSRDNALNAAVDALVSKALKYRDNRDGDGTKWTEGYANAVIDWAMTLMPALNQGTTAADAPPSSHPGTEDANAEAGVTDDSRSERSGEVIQPSDPVIRALCEAHRARKVFPAGHTFAMTNPVINGEQKTVGTCSCGHVFEYKWGSYEKMDAAIEAHWQSFDDLPDKIDGRGNPIPDITAALRAIDRGEKIDGEMARHVVGEGLAHATSKRLVLTDEGRALLAQSSDGRADEAVARDAGVASGSLEPGVATPVKDEHHESASEAGMGSEGPSPSETNVAPMAVPPSPRTEPAPIEAPTQNPEGAGSPVLEVAAPIGAGSEKEPWIEGEPKECDGSAWDRLPPVVRADDDDALLRWAEANAWREPSAVDAQGSFASEPLLDFSTDILALFDEEACRRQVALCEFEDGLPRMMGADERRRKLVEFKLALDQKPVNLGPLFGAVPPPLDFIETGEG